MQTQYYSRQNHNARLTKAYFDSNFMPVSENLVKSLHFTYFPDSKRPHDLLLNNTELHKWSQRQSLTERKTDSLKSNQKPQLQRKTARNSVNLNLNRQIFMEYPPTQTHCDNRSKHNRTKSNFIPGTNEFLFREHEKMNRMTNSKINEVPFNYQTQKRARRSLLQDTKKEILQFSQESVLLLNNIKIVGNQASLMQSPPKSPLEKIRRFSPTKKPLKASIQANFSKIQQKVNKFEDIIQKLKDLQRIKTPRLKKAHPMLTDDNFIMLKKLGGGNFAQVFLAVDKQTGFLVALKKIKKSILKSKKCEEQLLTEIKIQMFINHPNILKIYGCYADKETITLILEFMEEGNLYQKLKTQKKLSVDTVSQSIAQVLVALKFLHHTKIVHRDIKPDNVVINYGVRKLCDFGTAALCLDRRSTVCGTLDYTAPQLIQGEQYNEPLDIWSVGVMTYELLTGKPPFYHFRRKDTIKEIMEYQDGQINFPPELTNESVSFIRKFLIKDPQKRISIDEALKHKFIRLHADEQTKDLIIKYTSQNQKILKVQRIKTN